jgi:hypothetical protein
MKRALFLLAATGFALSAQAEIGLIRPPAPSPLPSFSPLPAALQPCPASIRVDTFATIAASDTPEAVERIIAAANASARRLTTELAQVGTGLDGDLRKCYAEYVNYFQAPTTMSEFQTRRDRIDADIRTHEENVRAEQAVLEKASEALGRMKSPAAVRRLIDASHRPGHRMVKLTLVRGLGALDAPEAAARLGEMVLSDGDVAVRVAAAEHLGGKPAGTALPILANALTRTPAPVQWAVLRAMEALDDPAAVPPLIEALPAAVGRTRDAMQDTLARLTGQNRIDGPAAWASWWEKARDGIAGTRPGRSERHSQAGLRGFPGNTVPTFLGLSISGRAVVFCVDVSGSMADAVPGTTTPAGTAPLRKIDLTRQELQRALSALPRDARFNLILFTWRLRMLSTNTLLPATHENIESALQLMRESSVGFGTSLSEALDRGLLLGRSPAGEVDPRHAPDAIYLLSDGEPTTGPIISGYGIRRRVADLNAVTRTPVHTVGFAPDARSGAFLRELSGENGGRFVARSR